MSLRGRDLRAFALALMVGLGLPAMAGTPRIFRGDNPHLESNLQRRFREIRASRSSSSLPRAKTPNTVRPGEVARKEDESPSPEAYSLVGLGYSEGWVDHVATNGNVVVWSNDTILGNFTFAPASDIAHPTAYYVGYGFTPTYGDAMQFVGDTLYVDNGGTDILEFDCADANNIQLVADFDLSCYVNPHGTTYWIQDFRVRNGYLWVALGSEGFAVYGLGNPSVPVMVGSPSNACDNYGLSAFDPAGLGMLCMHIEVTSDTMILVDDTPGAGLAYLWDITNMIDPLHTVLPYWSYSTTRFRYLGDCNVPPSYHSVALFGSSDLGAPYFESTYSNGAYHGIQIKYVAGSLCVSNSLTNGDRGLARFDWSDASAPDSLLAIHGSPCSVNQGATGRARHLNSFAVTDSGDTAFVSYEDVKDPSGNVTGDSGEKWNWSVWNSPVSAAIYTMDRFFFNWQPGLDPTPAGAYNVFYGGACIAFYSPGAGTYRALIAGWNYVGRFDDSGALLDHYTTGMDPQWWPLVSFHTPWSEFSPNPYSQPNYVMPAGASVWNLERTSDDAHVIVWEPEGFYVMDYWTGLRVGFWECPSRQDFVRNVALTSDGHYALAACGSLGLFTVDISDPTNPVTVGTWWTNPTAPAANRQPVTTVYVSSDPSIPDIAAYAYVQTRVLVTDASNPHANINVLRVLHINNPALPSEVAAYETAVGTYGGSLPSTVYWDVNHMTLAKVSAYGSHKFLQISNGQGIRNGPPLEAWNPAFSNSVQYHNYVSTGHGSFIVGDVANPALVANRFDASLQQYGYPWSPLAQGTYAFESAFFVPQSASNEWAYIADGLAEAVDMGNPAGGTSTTHPTSFQSGSSFPDPYGYGTLDLLGLGYPNYVDKIFRVKGMDQTATGYFFLWPILGFTGGLDHWDMGIPLHPMPLAPYGGNSTLCQFYGYWFDQLTDNTWLTTTWIGDVFVWSNKADYVPPVFSATGPNGDGWLSPYCGSEQCGAITGPKLLKVQVTDDVAVTRVRMRAYYDNGDHWDGCYPGYVALGDAAGPDAAHCWTLTVSPGQFTWTGWVKFQAMANDAGGNRTNQWNEGGDWFVAAPPSIGVNVGPAGTDYPYVWSVTSVSALVTTVPGDPDIAHVRFKVDGVLIGEGYYNPSTGRWYANWDTTAQTDGNHSVTAEVTTALGALGTSSPVSKFVANSGPASSITSPTSGQHVSGTINVSAQVDTSHPVPIDHVDFCLDSPTGNPTGGTAMGTATTGVSGLYSIAWDSETTTVGSHTVLAVAMDRRWDGSMHWKASPAVTFQKISSNPNPNPKEASPQGAPMMATKQSSTITKVTYTPGCGAKYHAVYWGHAPIGGSLSWTGSYCGFDATGILLANLPTPGPGVAYYFVVVGRNDTKEGSYGLNSAGAERPQAVGIGFCDKPQDLTGGCP